MTINLNGVEIYTAQEVEARIREAIAGKDKKVDMENLPIGTLVKVVGNRAGHEHEVGEILPITEVDEGILDELYRLDGRSVGWVAVDDIEFVSFPEEEESTSGNEEDPDLGFKSGDYAKVLKSNVIFDVGDVIKILDVEGDGHPLAVREDGVEGYAVASRLMKIDDVEDESEIKAGDTVIATEDEVGITEGVEYEIKEFKTGTLYFLDDDGDIRHVWVNEEILRKKIIEAIDEPKFEVGDILRCNKDFMGVTEGKLYEVLAIDIDGDAVYMDDGNSVSYANETDIPERFEIL